MDMFDCILMPLTVKDIPLAHFWRNWWENKCYIFKCCNNFVQFNWARAIEICFMSPSSDGKDTRLLSLVRRTHKHAAVCHFRWNALKEACRRHTGTENNTHNGIKKMSKNVFAAASGTIRRPWGMQARPMRQPATLIIATLFTWHPARPARVVEEEELQRHSASKLLGTEK